ncbi:MAG: hypothetical protein JHC31_12495 [Sulfurihydrogenibium sp.]|jgi:uncharacterized protein (UPF0248 family)|nr:hypothetical protein [Sulfurihydrogenibium sp.]
MPKKLEDCVKKVMAQGKSKSEAYAICSENTGYKKLKAVNGRKIREVNNGIYINSI